jgi:hypothetical protein
LVVAAVTDDDDEAELDAAIVKMEADLRHMERNLAKIKWLRDRRRELRARAAEAQFHEDVLIAWEPEAGDGVH